VGAEIASRLGWCSDGQSEYFLNLGKRNLANNMKQIFEMKLFKRLASVSVVAAYALSSGLCYAQQATPAPSPTLATAGEGKETKEPKKVVEQPKPPEPRFKLYGWVEAGITGNPDAPIDNHNFGHLWTDRANEPLLNQISIVGERALDPNATGFDWGFKAWFLYGSDARYSKSVGFLDLVTNDRVQPDFPELYASVHIPIPSTNGLDLKAGKYQDPMSAETFDPRNNVFYSHSYIFNFGIPENDLGGLATLHVNKYLDIYAGVNRGVNMAFSDNNSSVAFEGGIGLNFLDGNLAIVALTHDGPEDPLDNVDWRYLNDVTTTWKITKNFTSITDLNLIYDTIGGGKWGGGGAQYFTYSVNDWLQLGVRGEIFRDSQGFYVAQFRANNDFIHFERADNLFRPEFPTDPSNLGGGETTYLEVTGGVTIKPPLPKPIAGVLIRPEVRYDRALTDRFKPFNQNTKQDQWTFGLDLVLEF
jgi:Putative beta-barrel porin-2, OmpL-like. bbp2